MEKKTLTETPLRECLVPISNPAPPSDGADVGVPAPTASDHVLLLPFAGCPHRCLFCAQDKQRTASFFPDLLIPGSPCHLFVRFVDSIVDPPHPGRDLSVQVRLHGGTFYGLPGTAQTSMATGGRPYSNTGRIRCSTRPDAVAPQRLEILKRMGLDTVELGVQSFHTKALRLSERGYAGETGREGCCRVQESGLNWHPASARHAGFHTARISRRRAGLSRLFPRLPSILSVSRGGGNASRGTVEGRRVSPLGYGDDDRHAGSRACRRMGTPDSGHSPEPCPSLSWTTPYWSGRAIPALG